MKPLHIIVCVKPVPDFRSPVEFDQKTKTVKRGNVATVINPLDKNALEAALQLKESFGGKVTALSMAPPFAESVLREVLAFGADEAFLLSDPAFAGSDTLATAYVLAQGVKKIRDFDLVITGAASTDGNTAQVGPQVAEHLGLPHASFVTQVKRHSEHSLELTLKTEEGTILAEIDLPALITVSREINEPRTLGLFGIAAAAAKPLHILGSSDLEVDPERVGEKGSPTRIADIREVSFARKSELHEGTPEAISLLVKKFREWGVI
ncbi:electron transfer flavoprotein subunit beta/FixA family protein [Desulfofundulus thermosubterraneus]|uniref:Electron transfer flavoprotein small subunit n=1 Tax=Desulfofundulus thermosubterraneus DSM 16057 TaxID=1121432 RepID=A0A1M6GR35_9FIRM|nr:electron transfer flavoprotein subunit beta/FixA family protein [Desulfofundulus thermosubterraneus]SHJ12419.1 electron transfer flavoprotein beta subunit [Desulfofundulus thermosubterraneus DSM 16057]